MRIENLTAEITNLMNEREERMELVNKENEGKTYKTLTARLRDVNGLNDEIIVSIDNEMKVLKVEIEKLQAELE